ncbi:hypothetical protein HWB90_gp078 [Mycobacterium phage Fowlmouth]|uniref:Uncharacterized protein n=2 Tax=Fowlmouthvirus fowlmouth TaxID=2845652 RepID=A0A7G8LQ02_9CAUD|nr:hypothetical protein HWB90_gp078 [Mycobacterium phage Fowlmouth]AYN58061.1 hypothetical protein SEA_FOWLMOUTH_112 [Mycobacterium phage Fowlmouth]QNJ59324.1 hypothetical protein SEA_MRMIYAGI_111 [Mycobacterium phage MrMiyagi]
MCGDLPFHPWWHHPNHNYVGKHRGTYPYAHSKAPLPYGLRSIKITPYVGLTDFDLDESGFKPIGFTLPDSQWDEETLEVGGKPIATKRTHRTTMNVEITDVNQELIAQLLGVEICSQQSQSKGQHSSVAGRVKRFFEKVTRHLLRRVGK